ncbi:MAG: hypothetical protein QXY75_07185, partial [Candidatus Bathyarchaeia archaeon]
IWAAWVQIPPPAPSSRVQIPIPPFKSGNNEFGVKSEIYDYDERLERYRRIIAGFGRNGEAALRFLDHLASLGLSIARLSKVASHIPALLRHRLQLGGCD